VFYVFQKVAVALVTLAMGKINKTKQNLSLSNTQLPIRKLQHATEKKVDIQS
jgi:hypothetical protein